MEDSLEKAKYSVEQYLQLPRLSTDDNDRREAWRKLAALRRETGDLSGEIHALLEMCPLPRCPIESVSYTAGRALTVLSEQGQAWDKDEKQIVVGQLAEEMENRVAEMNSNDFGRLAWLHLHRNDEERARHFTKLGLRRDPDHRHLSKLAARLAIE